MFLPKHISLTCGMTGRCSTGRGNVFQWPAFSTEQKWILFLALTERERTSKGPKKIAVLWINLLGVRDWVDITRWLHVRLNYFLLLIYCIICYPIRICSFCVCLAYSSHGDSFMIFCHRMLSSCHYLKKVKHLSGLLFWRRRGLVGVYYTWEKCSNTFSYIHCL